jgi:hypothetical protein
VVLLDIKIRIDSWLQSKLQEERLKNPPSIGSRRQRIQCTLCTKQEEIYTLRIKKFKGINRKNIVHITYFSVCEAILQSLQNRFAESGKAPENLRDYIAISMTDFPRLR